MEDVKFKSLADIVFDQLESAILDNKYPQGTLLTEIALSKELKVSRTPIREAIRRLEQENLVKETPKGHTVLGISNKDICDIYDIRLKIEGTATAMCATAITPDALERLKEAVELQEFYTEKCMAQKINEVDSQFHEIIFNNCGSEVYGAILLTLHKKVKLGRKVSVSDSSRAKKAVKEHREIFNALQAKNAPLAEALAIKHINNAKISIMRIK